MKTIGLLGGMSWESTALYYRIINETVRDRLGSLHSARLILASVDFHVLTPEADDRDAVHRIIYEELCLGRVLDASRQAYREIIARLVARGAQAIVMGCTEITMLVKPDDSSVPLFDTTYLHAIAAAEWAVQTDSH